MRLRTPATVLVALLVLTGCSPEAREDIVDRIQGAVSDAESVVEEVTSPEEVAPTEEPTSEEPAPEPTTEEPTTEEPAPEPTEEATVDEPTDDGTVAGLPLWMWVLFALLVVLLVWAIVRARRRHAAVVARRDRLRDAALAEVDWLLGAARERAAGVDAAARARDVRLRLDRLTDTLQQLRSSGRQDVAALATDLQTSARQLADALVARLDDVAAGRGDGAALDVQQLAERVRSERDALGEALGRPPTA